MSKYNLLFLLGLMLLAGCASKDFTHDVTGEKKPWTHENFNTDDGKFSFVIIPDRTGDERPGVFPEAIKKANMLQPDFIMTVGDLIQGQMDIRYQSHDYLREQWKELVSFTSKSQAPFFYLVGNHDIARTREGFPLSNETSKEVWQEFAGNHTYYYFIYKDVLFLCLNSMECRDAKTKPQTDLSPAQIKWAREVLEKHPDVRWTMVFIHQPNSWGGKNYAQIEELLVKRNYTAFAGDWHCYCKFQRYGRNHYVLATAGGVSGLRGLEYGEFDHVTLVTMTKNGPVVTNILLDGILPDDVTTAKTIKRKIRKDMNYPLPEK